MGFLRFSCLAKTCICDKIRADEHSETAAVISAQCLGWHLYEQGKNTVRGYVTVPFLNCCAAIKIRRIRQ